ncbi:hypothetical protein M301_2698 [Methylotenera versatilis 301]|jgi:hypothetical protein|uniref:Uncharacterized protein n=2 Tax=Methylotenera TaxID=359407 RepID=D7DP22_METV0|nr:hypothetical protein M301_2698 [Methylotenera versatilis 301]
MGFIMKLNMIALALALSSQTAFAYQCNTVMGGCPTDTGVVTSTHMRSDLGVKVAHPEKAAVAPSKTGAAGSTGSAAKLPAKK